MFRTDDESAQATVELAMILPLIMTICLGIAQVGVVARQQIELTHAARAAARVAIVDPSAASVRSAALEASSLDGSRVEIRLSGDSSPGGLMEVTASYVSPTDLPLIGRFIGDITLSESLSVRVE